MNWKKIALYSLLGLIVLPTITLGSSLTISLIQGKTPGEAVGILAEQIDTTLTRLSLLEEKQAQLEQTVAEVENTVETIQASTTEAQEVTTEALADTSTEVEALKAELELERQKDIREAEQEAHALRCEDLKWAKGMAGKGTIIQFYENAVSRSTPDTFLLHLKTDYESELNDVLDRNTEYYEDYDDPDRIAYCESKEWCDEDDSSCAMVISEYANPETRKCNETLRVAEDVEEVEDWYQSEKTRLSNPNAVEYVGAKALATRLKPQYDEYLANCQ